MKLFLHITRHKDYAVIRWTFRRFLNFSRCHTDPCSYIFINIQEQYAAYELLYRSSINGFISDKFNQLIVSDKSNQLINVSNKYNQLMYFRHSHLTIEMARCIFVVVQLKWHLIDLPCTEFNIFFSVLIHICSFRHCRHRIFLESERDESFSTLVAT